jgi:hypothetical protein
MVVGFLKNPHHIKKSPSTLLSLHACAAFSRIHRKTPAGDD